MRPGDGAADRGFIMVAMLIAIAVAAVWMSAALPSWRQQAIREKEADLIFRGEQYARAVYLYRQRNNGAFPQDFDQLVSGRYLRKKYLDPITGKDFVPLGGLAPTFGGPTGRQGGQPGRAGQPAQAGQAPFTPAGITGVRSTSNEQSIMVYKNQSVYSQWPFDWTTAMSNAGAAPTPEAGFGRGQPRRGGEGPTRGIQGGGRGQVPPGGRGAPELAPITPGRGPGGGGVRGGGRGQ